MKTTKDTDKATEKTEAGEAAATGLNFIQEIIEEDGRTGKHRGRVATRFPPEPNGYLHIGHAKSICLNFGLAAKYGGLCNLRFDDTNPSTEDVEYVESILADVRWLGFDWDDRLYYASDYFEKLYERAVKLIRAGKAYVDSLNEDEIRELRGNYYKKGKESPYRSRSIEENLDLFSRMRKGEFKEGEHVLRARIDVDSPNMNMRDPILYRIRRERHHRTRDAWCIYPMYDYAHPLSDAIEGITHSVCTLEFENHRPLYDWFVAETGFVDPPQQIEFARLNLSYTVMSKRKLLELVEEKRVTGWDDPRMPTLAGLRRRGFTPEAIRDFCERIGVAKSDNVVDLALLEHCIREDLNRRAPRVMGVLNPLKVVITNFPEGKVEELDAPYNPEDPSQGSRKVPFSRTLFIERDDFREAPPPKWHRLAPGSEVRLRWACLLKCEEVVKDEKGEIRELRCTWDPESKGGRSPDGRKVPGTIHWVSAQHAIEAEVRLYDRLFNVPDPLAAAEGEDWKRHLNPDSLEVLSSCKVEPSLKGSKPGTRVQFERMGYFCVDPDTSATKLVFNRTATLRDSWAKIEKSMSTDPDRSRGAARRGGLRSGEDRVGDPKPEAGAPTPQAGPDQKAGGPAQSGAASEITIDDFAKLDLRVGLVVEASLVEGADKLLRLMIDLGEGRPRQIFAGIKKSYPDPAALVGRKVMVVVNLKPRKMKFGISEGMVLSAGDDDGLAISTFDRDPAPGSKVS